MTLKKENQLLPNLDLKEGQINNFAQPEVVDLRTVEFLQGGHPTSYNKWVTGSLTPGSGIYTSIVITGSRAHLKVCIQGTGSSCLVEGALF